MDWAGREWGAAQDAQSVTRKGLLAAVCLLSGLSGLKSMLFAFLLLVASLLAIALASLLLDSLWHQFCAVESIALSIVMLISAWRISSGLGLIHPCLGRYMGNECSL
jgi:hypothetical protein